MDFHSFHLVLCIKMRIRGVDMQLYSFLITTLDEVVSIAPRLFYPRERIPVYSLNKTLNEPQSWSACFKENKSSIPRIEPTILLLVAYSLHRLSYPGSSVVQSYEFYYPFQRPIKSRSRVCSPVYRNVPSTTLWTHFPDI
jgi:hypothetical protein